MAVPGEAVISAVPADSGGGAVYNTVRAFTARLVSHGVTDVVVSPGSRSTPLTLCLDASPHLSTWVQIDERSAGFFALGLSRATGRPTVLVCTSGTAAANYLPAVVEACHAGVPMIVCTADRPPEMRGWGFPQVIDQVGIYGTAVRLAVDLSAPEQMTKLGAEHWADRAVRAAAGPDRGPVHLNWPFSEPLEPQVETAAAPDATHTATAHPGNEHAAGHAQTTAPAEPSGGSREAKRSRAPEAALSELAEIVAAHERGVVVVGPWPGGGLQREQLWASSARQFAAWAKWPLIGEPLTGVRASGRIGSSPRRSAHNDSAQTPCVVATADHLLADEAFGDRMRPDVVVLAGRTFTSKHVRSWIERSEPAHVILIDPENRSGEAAFRFTSHIPASVEALRRNAESVPPPNRQNVAPVGPTNTALQDAPVCQTAAVGSGFWLEAWRMADTAARRRLDADIPADPLLSALTVRVLVEALPAGAVLMSSNSMPVRDMDAYIADTGSLFCTANRGAAGIDGIVSTALGLAAADTTRPAALYVGDLALLHDLTGLTAAAQLGLHLTVVCVDNGGGGIFSLLPIASRVDSGDFERLFRTPHGVRFDDLDGFGGIRARRVADATELSEALACSVGEAKPGIDLLVVQVDTDSDISQRRALTAAAQAAAESVLRHLELTVE